MSTSTSLSSGGGGFTARIFPYLLKVTIVDAKDLRIADILSSDPYAVITIGGRRFGATSWIANSLNPTWNETFHCDLLHIKSNLVINVMDHDDHNNDDALGKCEVDLQSLPIGTEVPLRCALQDVGATAAKGFVNMVLSLQRRDTVILISKMDFESSAELVPVPARLMEELFEEYNTYKTSPGVQRVLLNHVKMRLTERVPWPLLKDLLCEARSLSTNRSKDSDTHYDISDAFNSYIIRDRIYRGPDQAIRIDFLRPGNDSVAFPIQERNSMYLETQTDTFMIQAPNNIQCYCWIRALRRAVDDMKSGTNRSVRINGNLSILRPDGMKEYKCSLSSVVGQPLELVCEDKSEGGATFKLNLSTLKAVSLGHDLGFIHQYELVVNAVSANFESDKLTSSEPHRPFSENILGTSYERYTLSTEEDGDSNVSADDIPTHMTKVQSSDFYKVSDTFVDVAVEDEESRLNIHVNKQVTSNDFGTSIEETAKKEGSGWYAGKFLGKSVDGAGYLLSKTVKTTKTAGKLLKSGVVQTAAGATHVIAGAANVVNAVATTGVNVVVGTAETTINLATGKADASSVIESAASKTGAAISGVGRSFVTGISQELESRIVITSPHSRDLVTQPLGSTRPFWNESCIIGMTDNDLKEAMSSNSHGISMFLFQDKGDEIRERLPFNHLAASFIPTKELLLPYSESSSTVSNQSDVLNAPAPLVAHSMFPRKGMCESIVRDKLVEFGTDRIVIRITIISAQNLSPTPSNSTSGGKGRAPKVTVGFVKWFGEDRGKKTKHFKTRIKQNTLNPEWNEEFTFVDDDGLSWGKFIRLEVDDTNCQKHVDGRMGAAFIPIYDCPVESDIETTVSLTPHFPKEMNSALLTGRPISTVWGGGPVGSTSAPNLGTLRVRIRRTIERKVSPAYGYALIRSQLREVSARDSFWPAVSILSGSLFVTDVNAVSEECSVFAAFAGLVVRVNTKENQVAQNELSRFVLEVTAEDERLRAIKCAAVVASAPHVKLGTSSIFSHVAAKSPFDTSEKESRRRSSMGKDSIDNHFDANESRRRAEFYRSKYGNIVEVFVFENQRRNTVTSRWDGHNNRLLERPPFSDESGDYQFPFSSLSAAVPPEGFEWLEADWNIDQLYTDTDANGWSYAVDFIWLSKNYRNNCSNVKSADCSVRRRKWGRFARQCLYPRRGSNTFDGDIPSHTMNNSIRVQSNRESTFERERDTTILELSQERGPTDKNGCCAGPVLIPWTQILSIQVVTPSVLSVIVEVNRYLGLVTDAETGQKRENFVPVQCEVLIRPCPAAELLNLINERISMAGIRDNVKTLLNAGHIDGQSDGYDDESGPVELSFGAQTINNINDNMQQLKEQLDQLTPYLSESGSKNFNFAAAKEVHRIQIRLVRLQIYQSLLLEAKLKGCVVSEESAQQVYQADSATAENFYAAAISRGCSEVAASCEQVNFLLDAFESRISNFSLCGYFDLKLDKCLGVLINLYYMEVLRILAFFFDSMSKFESLSGNAIKLELISFVISNDDRFQLAADAALKPYDRVAKPCPVLSSCINTTTIIGWYSVMLHKEMKDWVDRCFKSERDYDHTSVDLNPLFKFPLPWEPLEEGRQSKKYLSHLRVTLIKVLKNYLEMPRPVPTPLTSKVMLEAIDVLNRSILSAYGTCFLYVASKLRSVLTEREWALPPIITPPLDEQGEFDAISGQMLWICSAANDAWYYYNHVDSMLRTEAKIFQEEKEEIIGKKISNNEHQNALKTSVASILSESKLSFTTDIKICADCLSCIVFTSISSVFVGDLSKEWLTAATLSIQRKDHSVMGVMKIENMQEPAVVDRSLLFNASDRAINITTRSISEEFSVYFELLEPPCYIEFVRMIADKFVIRYYCLLKEMQLRRVVFHEEELEVLRDEISRMVKCCIKGVLLMESDPESTSPFLDEITSKFDRLYDSIKLIDCPIDSDEILDTLNVIKSEADKYPITANALSIFIQTCVALRPDSIHVLAVSECVIPLLCRQIESHADKPPLIKESQSTAMFEKAEDMASLAEAALSEEHKTPLRPLPINLVFCTSDIFTDPGNVSSASSGFSAITRRFSIQTASNKIDTSAPDIVLGSRVKNALVSCQRFYSLQFTNAQVQQTTSSQNRLISNIASAKDADSTKGRKANVSMFDQMKGLFSGDHDRQAAPVTENIHSEVIPTPPKQRSFAFAVAQHEGSVLHQESAPENKNQTHILIKGISVHNLFSTDTMFHSKPNVFIKISAADVTVDSEVKFSECDPTWKEPNIKLYVAPGYFALRELVFVVHYKKKWGAPEVIGSVAIPLSKLDTEGIIDEEYQVNLRLSSDHVVNCSVKACAEGFSPPSMQINAILVRGDDN